MTSRRLPILLAALLLVAAIRIAFVPAATVGVVVEAVVRRAPVAVAAASTASDAGSAASAGAEVDVPRNAFFVRTAPEPLPPVPAPVAPPSPVAAPPTRPTAPVVAAADPEPIPPLQVIGTYDDGQATAVFIATPMGIRMARPGTLLMSEYQVAAIASGRITLTQVSSQRSFDLPLPALHRP